MNVPKLSLEQWAWIIYNAGLGVQKLYELATKDNITRADIDRAVGQLTTYRPDPLGVPPIEPTPGGVITPDPVRPPYYDVSNPLGTTWASIDQIPREKFGAGDRIMMSNPVVGDTFDKFLFVVPGFVSPSPDVTRLNPSLVEIIA